MAFPILGLHRKSQGNKVPLLMERADTRNDNEHVIDIASSSNASPSNSSHERPPSGLDQQLSEDQPSTSSRVPVYQPPLFSAGANSRNSSLIRRGNSRGRQRSPLNSALWISVELVLTVSQIIAAIIVLSFSKHENPRAPLRAWIVGYASGCLAILPLLYWRFKHRNQGSEQDASQRLDSTQGNNNAGPVTRRIIEGEDRRATGAVNRSNQILGFREDFAQNRGATQDSINSLPTYKFKVKKNKSGNDKENIEGGIVAAGTEKERAISGEDAVCCICLAKYANNDELRELPCSHFFHKECVDKWLKINASCPLCKAEVGETILSSLTEATANLRNSTIL
ncbi:hypothetical protein DH2020_036575 [Rehmannia glutinosa]|uniref:RING-type domain-containing protein n=1 Tax=Rehmannia glutinosa TaxID=99300 RepID=A0ABR0V674_REHGL